MTKPNATKNDPNPTPPYFAPLLAWQVSAWQRVTHQYLNDKLPHALLASGMAGIGKRLFVYRLVAWLLCQNKVIDGRPSLGACGACENCRLFKDTKEHLHPDVQTLPKSGERAIKIDDIRQLQDFFNGTHKGIRLVIIDNSETMTVAAANALLKTLEEPNAGIYLILITDMPARLLPTIKSRVQNLPLTDIDHTASYDYVKQAALDNDPDLLLNLADFAPLAAKDLPNKAWFIHRKAWLSTLIALQTGKRQVIQASDYWQKTLSFEDFMVLSRLMSIELWRLGLGLPPIHTDIKADIFSLVAALGLNEQYLTGFGELLDELTQATAQNVQEKLAYDRLFVYMATPLSAKSQPTMPPRKTQKTATQ